MSLFDTLFPQRTRRPVNRSKASRHRNRLLEQGEQLEQRKLLAVTITRSTTDQFFVDPDLAFRIDSQYAEYQITNNGPAVTDAWIKTTMLTGSPVVSFGPGVNNEDGLYRIGALGAGETKQAFIYFTTSATQDTDISDQYSVTAFDGQPASGTSLGSANFFFENVQLTQRNAVNKISTITFSNVNPVVGGTLTMNVTGRIGNTADRVLFTPASRVDWKPDVYRLQSVSIGVVGGPPSQNLLYFDPAPSGNPGKPFTADYNFVIDNFNTDPTQVQPTQFTQQNLQQWEHHDTPDFAFPPIPPVKPKIDLKIDKTDGSDTYVPGSPVTYTVTVTNQLTSEDKVTGVTVTDKIPDNTTFVSADPGVTYDSLTRTLTYVTGMILKGGTASFQFTISTLSTQTEDLINTAVASPPANVISTTTSSTDRDTAKPNVTLGVTKTDNSATYVPGSPVTYTIIVTNSGPSDLVGGTVSDLLPSVASSGTWTTSTTGSASVLPIAGGNNINATVNIPKGDSVTFTYTVQTKPDATADLVNTVFVTPPEGQGSSTSSTDRDTAKPNVTLGVTKTDNSATYVPGSPVTYTIIVTNSGPSDLVGGTVSDLLPSVASSGTWTTSTTGSASVLPIAGGNNINATVNIPKGDSVTFTYTVQTKPDATADLVNTVFVTPPEGQGSSTSSTDRDTAKPNVTLGVTKTDNSATYVPGSPVTYTIIVTNSGPSDLVGGTVSDLLPSVASSGTWTTSTTGSASVLPIAGGNNINATVNIPKGDSVTFTYTVQTKPDATADLVNTVFVTPPEGQGSSTSSTDRDTAKPNVTLGVTKTDNSATYVPGSPVTYTIIVTNSGPSDLVGGTVSDLLPSVASSGTWTTSTTGSASVLPIAGGNNINATVNIPKGDSVTFTYTVQTKPDATADLVNTVFVTPPEGQGSSTSSTDRDTAKPNVTLGVTKTDGKDTYVPGTSTTYTIIATNAGPSFLIGGTVSDPLPAQVASATWTAVYSAGSSGPDSGSGPLNETVDLAPGGTATFQFTVQIKPDATGNLVNTVTLTPPPNTQGNTTTATDINTFSSPQLLLNVTKTDGKTTYLPGQTFPYTIVVSNAGPSTMIDGLVNDPLASQVASASWTAVYTAGSSGPANGVGGITNEKITLLPNGKATFTLTVTIKSDAFGQMDNIVTLTPPAGASVDPQSVLSAKDSNFGPEPPASIGGALVIGSDDGCNGPPWVRVLDPNSGEELSRFLAYDSRFRGSVRVATGDVTGDGVAEIITAPSRNLVGEVRVFQQVLGGWAELAQYRTLAFGPKYRGGVEVAVADIDGDGDNDIVTGMSIQSGMVNVFRVTPGAGDPVANAPFKSFRGAPAGTNNGVMISAGDYILGGPAEIAVGTNSGTRALVRIFDVSGTPTVVRSFNPFANNFRGGVTLSTSDYDNNGSLDLIVGAGLNGGSRVEVWNPSTTTRIAQISAFGSLSKPNARVFAVFGSTADGFIGPDSTLYGVQGLNGGRGSKGVWKVLGGTANSLVNSQTILPPLRIAPIALRLG